MNKLSIIVPVYNEEKTISKVLAKLDKIDYIDKEIIIVDDCSTDNTLNKINNKNHIIKYHSYNKGKGAAIQTGLKYVSGDYVLIQDADLEYNPEDIKLLVEEAEKGNPVVYGTRFHKNQSHNLSLYYFGNRFLSFLTSLLFSSKISDMETGYKLFLTESIKPLDLEHKRFGFEPEITGKLLKSGYKIKEVPIRYYPRTKKEGKKITWRDGVKAFFILLKVRFNG